MDLLFTENTPFNSANKLHYRKRKGEDEYPATENWESAITIFLVSQVGDRGNGYDTHHP